MIRGIEQKPYFPTYYAQTDVTEADKLARIEKSQVRVRVERLISSSAIHSRVPFSEESVFGVVDSYPGILVCHRIALGDSELYRQGIGSRILRATTRYAVEKSGVETAEFFNPNIASLNLAVKVFGEEAIALRSRAGTEYGAGTERPIETVFDDFPFEPSSLYPYIFHSVTAKIDQDTARSWEAPLVF